VPAGDAPAGAPLLISPNEGSGVTTAHDTASGTGNAPQTGGAGDDALAGQGGRDVLAGLGGNDTLSGGSGSDRIEGGTGTDLLYGGTEGNGLEGGAGDDVVLGEAWNDRLTGGHGRDTVASGQGDDTASGGEDADLLSGQAGDDFLGGDAGGDRLFGEEEDDVFVFAPGSGRDTISGFGQSSADDDVIRFAPDSFTSFEQVMGNTRQDGSGVVITGGTGDAVTLVNVSLLPLTPMNFIFGEERRALRRIPCDRQRPSLMKALVHDLRRLALLREYRSPSWPRAFSAGPTAGRLASRSPAQAAPAAGSRQPIPTNCRAPSRLRAALPCSGITLPEHLRLAAPDSKNRTIPHLK